MPGSTARELVLSVAPLDAPFGTGTGWLTIEDESHPVEVMLRDGFYTFASPEDTGDTTTAVFLPFGDGLHLVAWSERDADDDDAEPDPGATSYAVVSLRDDGWFRMFLPDCGNFPARMRAEAGLFPEGLFDTCAVTRPEQLAAVMQWVASEVDFSRDSDDVKSMRLKLD